MNLKYINTVIAKGVAYIHDSMKQSHSTACIANLSSGDLVWYDSLLEETVPYCLLNPDDIGINWVLSIHSNVCNFLLCLLINNLSDWE